MGILTDDMKRVVRQQRIGFVATVCPDGTPNLSPKGTAAVWDDDHLLFADLASPVTMDNLRHNSSIEINLVDLYSRKGYRFKGIAHIVDREKEPGLHEEIFQAYENGGRGVHQVRLPARAYVLIKVERPCRWFRRLICRELRKGKPGRPGRVIGPAFTRTGWSSWKKGDRARGICPQ